MNELHSYFQYPKTHSRIANERTKNIIRLNSDLSTFQMEFRFDYMAHSLTHTKKATILFPYVPRNVFPMQIQIQNEKKNSERKKIWVLEFIEFTCRIHFMTDLTEIL